MEMTVNEEKVRVKRPPLLAAGCPRRRPELNKHWVVLPTLTRGEKMLADGSRYAAIPNSLGRTSPALLNLLLPAYRRGLPRHD